MTGCDVAQQVQATGSNCTPQATGGNPPLNDKDKTIQTIPPTKESLSFLDKINSLIKAKGGKIGKRRRKTRKIYK